MPAEQINPVAVEAMQEVGIDITAERPKVLTTEAVRDSDVVITMGAGTIGHTGFTGTGLWIDFDRGLAWTLLTNRVHPTRHRDSGIFALRPAVGDAVIAAAGG